MYEIYWHGNLLRTFSADEREKALQCWDWFNGFLLPSKLKFKENEESNESN